MKQSKSRFVAGTHTMSITVRQGKRGFNVASTVREAGKKGVTGSRSTHETEEAATAAYSALVADATAKGWQARTKAARTSSSFAEIPTPEQAAALTANAPAKTAKPAAANGGAKSGKSGGKK